MCLLNQKEQYPDTWLSLAPKFVKKFSDVYSNWADTLNVENKTQVTFEKIKELLEDFIKISEIDFLDEILTNTCVIYSSLVSIPSKYKDSKGNLKDDFTKVLSEVTSNDSGILNSFYIKDLQIVSDYLKTNKKKTTKSISEYLNDQEAIDKKDLRNDRLSLKKYSAPKYLKTSRWPTSAKYPLSLAQQIAVNIGLEKEEGIFSVNGPPGTGKTTLLRDIIADIIFKRAQILSSYKNPKDAFKNLQDISIEKYKYKITNLDDKLLGYEIVIASSNNAAVENISKEIPKKSEIDDIYDLDYFSQIASNVVGDECWGLGSAILGNKTNINNFFEKFWDKKPLSDKDKKIIDPNYGLNYLLNEIKPEYSWDNAKNDFLEKIKKLELLQSEIVKFQNFHLEKGNYKSNIDKLNKEILNEEKQKNSLGNKLDRILLDINHNESLYQAKSLSLLHTDKLKPSWYVIILDIFRRKDSYQNWVNHCSKLIKEVNQISEKKISLEVELHKYKILIKDSEANLQKLRSKIDSINRSLAEQENELGEIVKKYDSNLELLDDDFWKYSSEKDLHLLSPWSSLELQDIRAELFVSAMNLHKAFIINSSQYLTNNIKFLKHLLSSNVFTKEIKENIRHLWASFFLIVPTISTTFASYATLFGNINEESIGNLLIDEAGQASPQASAGAIYRAKRVFVVGDPMQIEPVMTLPMAINGVLMEYHKIDKKWDVLEESVQTIADRNNKYGAYIGKSLNQKWVGCPLIVHRRCANPMFDIANEIAYDNMMINATKSSAISLDKLIKKSKWINIESEKYDNHWSLEEGKKVVSIIKNMFDYDQKLPSLYIISPFKNVAFNMKQYIKLNALELFGNYDKELVKSLPKWINSSIGTIHTFQGKQADIVILLLGGDIKKMGAINWASSKPNLLNVALTRAKSYIIVVGNHAAWSVKPYFQELAAKIGVDTDII
jgi:superfamily I DNA and/or RNA helicase